MKIFISWSGPLSRYIAETLRDWLPSVLQTVEPYVSSEDISKGTRWGVDVSRELEAADYGILCVTATNIDAPWLNFEASALSKSLEKSRVSPFLFDIEPSNIPSGRPLLQFQYTLYERDDVFKLIRSINEISEAPLEPRRLHEASEMWWPKLQEKLDRAESPIPVEDAKEVKRPVEEMLAELLDLARAEQRMLFELDQRTPRQSASTIEIRVLYDALKALHDSGKINPVDLVKTIPSDTARLLSSWVKENQSRSSTEAMNADLKSPDD